MILVEVIHNDDCHFAQVKTDRGIIEFTLNQDGSIYVLNRDGGPETQSEKTFMDRITAQELLELKTLSQDLIEHFAEE